MIQVGSTVGNFQITAVLGEGAMATVFQGEHPRIGKRVAIKVIHPELATSPEMVSRFFTEARAVSQIRHEHLVEIQDYGQTPEGDNFIIMEHLDGRTLSVILEPAQRLPAARAVAIALQIAEALGAAHDHGVVHRDLKPDNIFLLRRGGREDFVKVLDFGLAKLTGGPGAMQRDHKTRTGSVLGTPHYMAPEQAEGKSSVDPRADVYSLGCILFRMLSGVLPFPGEGFGEVLVKHLRELPPPLRQLAPEVSPALEKVVLHAMAKRREFRFQDIGELWQALREPERFAAHIGNDQRQIMGPAPGEPEVLPPRPPFVGTLGRMGTQDAGQSALGVLNPSGLPNAAASAAASAALSAHGAGVQVASPEQRTMIGGMMAPVLPPPGGGTPPPGMPYGAPPPGGGPPPPGPPQYGAPPQYAAPPQAQGHNRTLLVDAPQAPQAPQASAMPGLAGAHGTGTLIADLSAPGMAAARSALQQPMHHPQPPYPGQAAAQQPSRRGLLLGLLGGAAVLGVGGGVLVPRLLKPKIFKVTVTSVPPKALVLRDGVSLGEAPVELQLKSGDPPVRLVLKKEGHADALRTLSAPAEPTLEVRLLAKPAPPPPEPPDEDDKKAEAEAAARKAAEEEPPKKGKGKGKPQKAPKEEAKPKPKEEAKPKPKPQGDGSKPKPKPKKPNVVVPF